MVIQQTQETKDNVVFVFSQELTGFYWQFNEVYMGEKLYEDLQE